MPLSKRTAKKSENKINNKQRTNQITDCPYQARECFEELRGHNRQDNLVRRQVHFPAHLPARAGLTQRCKTTKELIENTWLLPNRIDSERGGGTRRRGHRERGERRRDSSGCEAQNNAQNEGARGHNHDRKRPTFSVRAGGVVSPLGRRQLNKRNEC